jgi:hypothetical protein
MITSLRFCVPKFQKTVLRLMLNRNNVSIVWTSTSVQAWEIDVIYGDSGNPGLVCIQRSCPSEKVYKLLNATLSDFNLNVQSNIFNITSDLLGEFLCFTSDFRIFYKVVSKYSWFLVKYRMMKLGKSRISRIAIFINSGNQYHEIETLSGNIQL